MNEKVDVTERRQHSRTVVRNIVVGVLNTSEPGLIGFITDISVGGVKFTYQESRKQFPKDLIHSIELRADNSECMFDFSCSYAWGNKVTTASDSELTNLRQFGIKFDKLTPWQSAMLKSIINDCSSSRSARKASYDLET